VTSLEFTAARLRQILAPAAHSAEGGALIQEFFPGVENWMADESSGKLACIRASWRGCSTTG
jgi:hypothetical protein